MIIMYSVPWPSHSLVNLPAHYTALWTSLLSTPLEISFEAYFSFKNLGFLTPHPLLIIPLIWSKFLSKKVWLLYTRKRPSEEPVWSALQYATSWQLKTGQNRTSYTTSLIKGLYDRGLTSFKHGGPFFDYGLIRKPQWNIIWSSYSFLHSHSNYRFVLYFFHWFRQTIYTRELFSLVNPVLRFDDVFEETREKEHCSKNVAAHNEWRVLCGLRSICITISKWRL